LKNPTPGIIGQFKKEEALNQMRERLFSVKARYMFILGLVAIFFLLTVSWYAQRGIRSGTVLAQSPVTPENVPSILGFNISRTVLSHGRVGNARQATPFNPNGLRDVQGFGDPIRGTPGLLTTIATPSPAWQPDSLHITMGWDPTFSSTPLGIGDSDTNPVTMAALGIPSCFVLVVAEGTAAAFSGIPGSIPDATNWQSTGPLIGEGNLYASVSIPAAGIVAGMELRTEEQLAAYTANSIIWEAPPFGFLVQDTTLMQFGTKKITANAVDITNPASPVMGPVQAVQVEITRTLHVEIRVLGIAKNHDGSFRLCAIVNMFGNTLEPVPSFWFRWGYAGQTVSLVGDIPGTNIVTIPRIPASEENQQAVLYVVASCNGSTLTGNPFTAEPLDVPPMVFARKSIGLLTFVSGGCTLEDNESVKITPFGECPCAHAMIVNMKKTGASQSNKVWTRKTPAAGNVVFEKPEAAAMVTITENSCTFRETNPSGEPVSNTVTWTIPPESMIDDGRPDPEITYGIQDHATDGLSRQERLARGVAKCRYQGQISVTRNPFASIGTNGFYQSDSAHGSRQMSGAVASLTPDYLLAPVGFDLDRSDLPGLPPESFMSLIIDVDPWKGESFSITIRWRYEYTGNETLAVVIRDGQEMEARAGMEIFETDLVRTASNCNLDVAITGENPSLLAALGVLESTEFEIRQLALGKPNRFDFAVKSGKIRSEVFSERSPTQFKINLPTTVVSVTGTVFTTGYNAQEQTSTVAVEKGAVLVMPTNTALQPVTLNAGQQVKVATNNISPITAFSTGLVGLDGKFLYIGIGAALLVLIVISMLIVSRAKPKGGQPQTRLSTNSTVQPPQVISAACAKCGVLLKPEKSFCTACGAPRQPISESKTPIRTGSITKLCQNRQCQQPLVLGKKFCTKCGTPVI
jgi:hypothetical protein